MQYKKMICMSLLIALVLGIALSITLAQNQASEPTLDLSPLDVGSPGTVVAIKGSGFVPEKSYRIFFDSNKDSKYSSGEPYNNVKADAEGCFETYLVVPSVPSDEYNIVAYRYWKPAGVVASAPFTVIQVFEKLWELEDELGEVKGAMFTISDHALFDTTGGDYGAMCSSDKPFVFYLVATAYGGPSTIRITFHDGDMIEFKLLEDGDRISFTQAAGGTEGVDDLLTVTVESGDAVGWISILTQSNASPLEPMTNFCETIQKPT